MRKLLFVYRWPILAIAIWIVIAFVQFGWDFATGLWRVLRDVEWWVENTFSVIIFTVLISWVVSIADRHREKADMAPYADRRIVLRGLAKDPGPQGIHWQDAQKIDISTFEKWKSIKSAVSSICWIETPTLADAEGRWLSYERGGTRIIIDFTKMKKEDVKDYNGLLGKLKRVGT